MVRHAGFALFVVVMLVMLEMLGHVVHAAPKASPPVVAVTPVVENEKQVRHLAPTLGTETLSLPEGMPIASSDQGTVSRGQ